MPRKSPYLTIKEKRKFMADIVRDNSGTYTMNEKIKAVIEDTKLEELDLERNPPEPPPPPPEDKSGGVRWDILAHLPPAENYPIPAPMRPRAADDPRAEDEAE